MQFWKPYSMHAFINWQSSRLIEALKIPSLASGSRPSLGEIFESWEKGCIVNDAMGW